MKMEEFIEGAIKLFGLYELAFNASESAMQIIANVLQLKHLSYANSYYFMCLVFECLIGWSLLTYSKRIAQWVLSFGEGKPAGN